LFNTCDLIGKKRDGISLSKEEIDFLIEGITDKSIPDYQVTAWLMAVYFRGMSYEETNFLTKAMLNSGEVLQLKSIKGTTIDKHSTGGVGDKVSLPLVPIVASLGVPIPMISGRGLGHTGGTLDKLESIPGFNVNLSAAQFESMIAKIGCSMIGQTKEIAPADKILYSLRDVTATTSSIPLITSSIMSKKLAEGSDGFVFDVKFGHGAFMKELKSATELANSLVQTAELSNNTSIAYLTNMDQPLGFKIGNWLEIEETIDILKGKGPRDLQIITYLFSATMAYLGKKVDSIEEGVICSVEAVKSGKAFEKFLEIVTEQGGDALVVQNPETYPRAAHLLEISADSAGYMASINSLELGLANVALGGGRLKTSDLIDPCVGIEIFHKVGERVEDGDLIAKVYYNDGVEMGELKGRIERAFSISSSPCDPLELIDSAISKNCDIDIQKLISTIEREVL
jgi:pyrimidine-nucleoside phosphorylase